MKKFPILLLTTAVSLFLLIYLNFLNSNEDPLASNTIIETENYEYKVIAKDLSSPWAIAMIDDNNILFTELSGQLRRIRDGVLEQESVSGVTEVLFEGQGGLSGIILDPNFEDNNRLYLAFSSPDKGKRTNTLEVLSAILDENSLTNINTIFKACLL